MLELIIGLVESIKLTFFSEGILFGILVNVGFYLIALEISLMYFMLMHIIYLFDYS
jgi:hypothetical protein